MNILFLTLLKIETLQARGIYHDLMRELADRGHHIYIVSPIQRREKRPSSLTAEGNVHFLNVRTLNIQKANVVEKGIATLSIELLYLRGVKKYFDDIKFDLIIYSTPPITFTKIIEYIVNKDGAKSYLLLKDIFPQNAVDMKMMSKGGLIYNFFRAKEKKLYEISDYIGCMSQANKQYLITHNPKIDQKKIEVNPNSIEPIPFLRVSEDEKNRVKQKYSLPINKKIFIYGGNLGVPQGLDFLLQTIENTQQDPRMFFLIVGSGTEFEKIQKWFNKVKPNNACLLSNLPKDEYDELIRVCDVGLILLHKDFTIPNFPSRLLSHLECKQPLLIAADPYTDIGPEVMKHECGLSILSGDIKAILDALDYFCKLSIPELNEMGEKGRKYLEKEFQVKLTADKISEKLTI